MENRHRRVVIHDDGESILAGKVWLRLECIYIWRRRFEFEVEFGGDLKNEWILFLKNESSLFSLDFDLGEIED